ncbi:MAG TPA: hypothetical protein VF119_05760, partial [Candidatus Limnocylindrales bacterium]
MLRRLTRIGLASFVGFGRGIWLFPLDATFKTVGLRYGWLRALFIGTPAPLLRTIGRLRAERAAWRATRRVPAYGAFLGASGVDVAGLFPLGVLGKLPETDKLGYVDRYGLLDRCVGGTVPFPGTTLDESSGSTGTPYNWIRGRREREVAHRNIGFFARYAFGSGPLVTLNAFSMGSWAAGFNMSLGMMRHGIVKSIGPDLDKILSTLVYLGPTHRFLIAGYPPFLKHLLDEGERRGFPWADYELHALVGGEGHDRGAARPPARALRLRLLGLRCDRHRDRHGRRVAGVDRRPQARPGPAGHRAAALRIRFQAADGLP